MGSSSGGMGRCVGCRQGSLWEDGIWMSPNHACQRRRMWLRFKGHCLTAPECGPGEFLGQRDIFCCAAHQPASPS